MTLPTTNIHKLSRGHIELFATAQTRSKINNIPGPVCQVAPYSVCNQVNILLNLKVHTFFPSLCILHSFTSALLSSFSMFSPFALCSGSRLRTQSKSTTIFRLNILHSAFFFRFLVLFLLLPRYFYLYSPLQSFSICLVFVLGSLSFYFHLLL